MKTNCKNRACFLASVFSAFGILLVSSGCQNEGEGVKTLHLTLSPHPNARPTS